MFLLINKINIFSHASNMVSLNKTMHSTGNKLFGHKKVFIEHP